jgi:hypothetical protein
VCGHGTGWTASGGTLTLAGLPPRIRRIFDIAGLTGEVLAFHHSIEQAIGAVRAKSGNGHSIITRTRVSPVADGRATRAVFRHGNS